jgi:hypothetical protein
MKYFRGFRGGGRVAALLFLPIVVSAQSPLQVWLEPDGVQRSNVPMKIRARGQVGTDVTFNILRSCAGDGRPSLASGGPCQSPLYSWQFKLQAELSETQLDFNVHAEVPRGSDLWLQAFAHDNPGNARFMHFAVDEGYCGIWRSIFDLLRAGSCSPNLSEAFFKTYGPSKPPVLKDLTVHLAQRDGTSPEALEVTGGATGVAWHDGTSLWITRSVSGGAASRLPTPVDNGLYLYDIGTQAIREVWSAGGRTPTAPLSLADGRVAFSLNASPTKPAVLIVLNGQAEEFQIPLPFDLYRTVTSDPIRHTIWGVTLRDEGPRFIEIDLREGRVVDWAWNESAYRAAVTSPDGKAAIVEHSGLIGNDDWVLHVITSSGERTFSATGLDVLAVWRPDGRMVAFLRRNQRWKGK